MLPTVLGAVGTEPFCLYAVAPTCCNTQVGSAGRGPPVAIHKSEAPAGRGPPRLPDAPGCKFVTAVVGSTPICHGQCSPLCQVQSGLGRFCGTGFRKNHFFDYRGDTNANTTISAGKVKAGVTILYDSPVLVSSKSPSITTEKSVYSRSPSDDTLTGFCTLAFSFD